MEKAHSIDDARGVDALRLELFHDAATLGTTGKVPLAGRSRGGSGANKDKRTSKSDHTLCRGAHRGGQSRDARSRERGASEGVPSVCSAKVTLTRSR